ncbi:MAG TPA: phosphate/phosphite/phosphonate ABC transporter substrate-binding protein [Sandaracinaceae bacterium LLY-WYZ-13_1]|nr:phosphate/phosphite/phosphonate ABC transporter substrate-binding protein [Sandaracinaceae bacterium LLY-WYZ-13_1]
MPVSDDPDTRAHLNDLCGAIGDRLGVAVHAHRAPSAGALANAFRAGRVHLAWTSPAAAAIDPRLSEAVPLVRSVRGGATRYHAVVVARRDGRLRAPGDVRDVRAAWVAPTSAGGHLFGRRALEAHGVDLATAFASEVFLGSQRAVVEAVRDGRADVGATFAVFQGGDPRRPLERAGFDVSGDELRVLCASEAIPSDVVLASPALLNTVRVEPVEALTHLHEDPNAAAALRQVLGADRFEPCAPDELERLRDLLGDDVVSAAG